MLSSRRMSGRLPFQVSAPGSVSLTSGISHEASETALRATEYAVSLSVGVRQDPYRIEPAF